MAQKFNKKVIVHSKCGKGHIDKGRYSEFNHRRHLCYYCGVYFYDKEKGVGAKPNTQKKGG